MTYILHKAEWVKGKWILDEGWWGCEDWIYICCIPYAATTRPPSVDHGVPHPDFRSCDGSMRQATITPAS